MAIFTPLSELSTTDKIIEVPKRLLSKLKATANEEANNVTNIIHNIHDSVMNRKDKVSNTRREK